MPQMSPLSWTLLYIIFSALLMTTMVINYYTFLYKPFKQTLKNNIKNINWKW
uniref:ATP synthase complex subunit 8 n=1 Tax=Scolytinae sp. BMNH 1039990 TaxID=1903772 RepID=A0A343A4M5_9CUCU|nr:ATP synthase F0 subunit 8 [Scolytinae sp. BMNH 1039990]